MIKKINNFKLRLYWFSINNLSKKELKNLLLRVKLPKNLQKIDYKDVPPNIRNIFLGYSDQNIQYMIFIHFFLFKSVLVFILYFINHYFDSFF